MREKPIPQIQVEIKKEVEMLMKATPISICSLSKAYTDAIEGCLLTSLTKIAYFALDINIELVSSEMEQIGRNRAVDYILRHSSGKLENGDIRFDNITQKTLEKARRRSI